MEDHYRLLFPNPLRLNENENLMLADAMAPKIPDFEIEPCFRERTPEAFNKMAELQRSFLSSLAESIMTDVSEIPAGYTYFGQFLDHDLSFDSRSDRDERSHSPFVEPGAGGLINKHKPVFDLESVYGVDGRSGPMLDGPFFRIGSTRPQTNNPVHGLLLNLSHESDLPRTNVKADIPDPRNDENFFLAQLHVLFLKFHNAIVRDLLGRGEDPQQVFLKAKTKAIRHYQSIIRYDFLPRILEDYVLTRVAERIETGGETFFAPESNDLHLPFEFTVAAFRVGHSMIRNGYIINANPRPPTDITPLADIFRLTGRANLACVGSLGSSWILKFSNFFEIGVRPPSFNFARKLKTTFAELLSHMPANANGDPRLNSLAHIDLARAASRGLASGQYVRECLAERYPWCFQVDPAALRSRLPEGLADSMGHHTPLLFYFLVESVLQNGGMKFGDTAGIIVAEVFLRLLALSPDSILSNPMTKDEFVGTSDSLEFSMPQLIEFLNRNSDSNEISMLEPK